MNHKFTLENYSSRRQTRFDCPRCNGKKAFVRYIDTETNKHLGELVGKCNRESNCCYHYPPKQFFADNPQIKTEMFADFKPNDKRANRRIYHAPKASSVKPFDCLEPNAVKLSLKNYEQNGLANYLFSIIESAEVEKALERYLVGTWTGKEAVFWQIDGQGRVRTGKLIDYCPSTGKRRKTAYSANWVHSELKKLGELGDDFELSQCFFGEHLLGEEINKPVAIVESEKTAIIASIFQPGFVWLAVGGKSHLKPERLRKLIGREIVLFPDADAFEQWNETALNACRFGLNVSVSDVIERFATDEEKQRGFDIADYILSSKIAERENSNEIIDRILNDADLFDSFSERMAIMEFGNNLAPEEVDRPEFVRAIAAYIYAENEHRRAEIV